MIRTQTAKDRKQEALREDLWPDSGQRVWRASAETGYCCLPRVLPLLLRLMNDKRVIGDRGGDCGTVYLELLARGREQGVVELGNEAEHAYMAGYSGSRASRSWKERLAGLEEAGFIEIKPGPNRSVGVALLVHPHLVVTHLRDRGLVDDEWWATYQRLQREHGASAPKSAPKKLKLVEPKSRPGAVRGTRRSPHKQ